MKYVNPETALIVTAVPDGIVMGQGIYLLLVLMVAAADIVNAVMEEQLIPMAITVVPAEQCISAITVLGILM